MAASTSAATLMLKLSLALAWLACILVVHLRGRVRHSFWGQVFDHSGLLAPVNVFLYAFSATPNRPFAPAADFPQLEVLRRHADVLREEGLALMAHASVRRPDQGDDAGFNSFAKSGWKRFYLKWYGEAHPSALRLCPRSTALLRELPGVSGAMFAVLPPGAVLNPHRDPYAGSLRYHLGLVTPNDDRCFIEVDGQRYSWRDGEAVIFDETFIHAAGNGTDVERPMKTPFARRFNAWFGRHVVAAAAAPNEAGDRVGVLNRLFFLSTIAGRYRRRFKAWNRGAYKLAKGALAVAVVALLVPHPVYHRLAGLAGLTAASRAEAAPTPHDPAMASRQRQARSHRG